MSTVTPAFNQHSAKVAVLMGGRSMERDISMLSGTGVLNALKQKGVNAHEFDPAKRPLQALVDEHFTHAFISLHGRYGEDGTVQGALELLGIPYTGSGVMSSALSMDKVATKRIWLSHQLRTAEFEVLSAEDLSLDALKGVAKRVGYPLMVKPPHEGSSIGISKAHDLASFEEAVNLAKQYDRDILCERFISGKELTCPILGEGAGAKALPVVRIQAPEGAYDYQNKYFTDLVQYQCPSGLHGQLDEHVQELSLKAYRALGCRGWGRLDLILDEQTLEPYLLEMNTSPGMTSHSLVPMSAKASGMSYEDLCLEILMAATLTKPYGEKNRPTDSTQKEHA